MDKQHTAPQHDDIFAKGFNAGYILQQEEPELAERLSQSLHSEHDYTKGIEAGREQYIIEMKERIQEYTRQHPSPSQGQDRGHSMDR